AVASEEELARLLATFDPIDAVGLAPALLARRAESPPALLALGRALGGVAGEACAVAAVVRASRTGAPIDPTAAELIELRTWRRGDPPEPLVGVDLLAEA